MQQTAGRWQACRSGGEAGATTASVLGVRVLEREAALPELALDIVDFNARQVHGAHRVDEALHAFDVEHKVARALVLLDVEAVLEAAAAAANHCHAQAAASQALALDGLFDHRGGLVG